MSYAELFKKYSDDEFLKFERVENPKSTRPDVSGFILLSELFPSNRDIVCASQHDEIFLDVSCEELQTLTEEHVVELLRCGIRYDDETDSLCMFV